MSSNKLPKCLHTVNKITSKQMFKQHFNKSIAYEAKKKEKERKNNNKTTIDYTQTLYWWHGAILLYRIL